MISGRAAVEVGAKVQLNYEIPVHRLTKPSSYGPSRRGPFSDPLATA